MVSRHARGFYRADGTPQSDVAPRSGGQMTGTGSNARWIAGTLPLLVAATVAAGASLGVRVNGQGMDAAGQSVADPPSSLRPAALDHLMRLRDRLDLGPLSLERLARDGSDDARRVLETLATERRVPSAVAALVRLGDTSQIGTATQLLTDRTLNDPVQIFTALEQMNVAEAAAALLPWLQAPEDDVASRAALALGRLNYRPATAELRGIMAGPNRLRRPAAAAALWRLGERDVLPDLDQFLANFLPEVKLGAAAAWAPEKDGKWRAAVSPLLADPYPTRRIAAARLLASIDPGSVRRAMGEDMRSLQDPLLRSEAASVFETVATPADSARLAEALDDPDAAVQLYAAGAVLRITSREAVPQKGLR
jgi:HEAT repeat protein